MNQTDLYCDVLRGRYHSQESLNRDVGAKAAGVLSVGIALVGAGAIILKISNADDLAPLMAFLVLLGTFALTALSSLLTLYPRDWRYGPKTADLVDMLGAYQDHEITRVTGDIYGKAIAYNQKVLASKAIALQAGTISLALTVGALAALAILSYRSSV